MVGVSLCALELFVAAYPPSTHCVLPAPLQLRREFARQLQVEVR